MAVVGFVGSGLHLNKFVPQPFDNVFSKIQPYSIVGLDLETNVVKDLLKRELRVLSISVNDGEYMAVFQWSHLSDTQKKALMDFLVVRTCIAHNNVFEINTIRNETGVKLENIVCTMLGEQLLTLGYTGVNNSLKAMYDRRFEIDLSKDEQKSFDAEHYTDNQVRYAALDTFRLERAYKQQVAEMKSDDKFFTSHLKGHKGKYKTLWLENEFSKVVADMEYNGILLDKEAWYKISEHLQPIYIKEKLILDRKVMELMPDYLIKEGYLNDREIVQDIWGSTKSKTQVLEKLLGFEVKGTSKKALKELLRDKDPEFPKELKKSLNGKKWNEHQYPYSGEGTFGIVKLLILMGRDNKEQCLPLLNKKLSVDLREWAIEQGFVIPMGTLTLNWGSPVQRLGIFRQLIPDLESTKSEELEDHAEHELIAHYLDWQQANYQLNNFGKKFYDDYVCQDGRHRPRYKQILKTGRLSTSEPNILNIPGKVDYFRAAVKATPGWKFINADYDGKRKNIYKLVS